jgi:protein gp37
MAKHNPGDLLTSDWNQVVGCQRYSVGCRDCWWLDGIMPWQIRLGNLVLGSETGPGRPRPLNLDWARQVRDFAVTNDLPFFVKKVGSSHKAPVRTLDGRTWDEFPAGFVK